jgi:hypothetical protein
VAASRANCSAAAAHRPQQWHARTGNIILFNRMHSRGNADIGEEEGGD